MEELEIINEDYEEKQLQWNIARYYCNFFSGVICYLLHVSLWQHYTDRATKCYRFGKIFEKPEVFPINVSQTESPISTPKVVTLDSSYRRMLCLILNKEQNVYVETTDKVDKNLWWKGSDMDYLSSCDG